MCGIAGSINFKLDLEVLKQSLYHRGPDKQSFYQYEKVSLFHSRLSIQDLISGQQPYHFENYSIIFNGEIYNHLELRKELKEFSFTTNSDTETLLKLYIKYKDKFFEKIDGMFAFCILDKNENKLILAKDRVGKKPLYLYSNNSNLIFASELNSIKHQVKDLKINETAIESYLRCGFFFEEFTAYENIQNLKAGHYYEIDISTLDIVEKQYFDLKDYYDIKNNLSFEESLNKLDNLLHKSIKNRIESSDLEVGAFLSGGIDSSLIVAIASQYIDDLKTFTVSFEGGYDESSLAQLTANKYNTNHHKISISMNLKNDIEKILLNYGQPFMDSSAIPSYYVSQEAKKHVTVILNGDGADELFGGYRRYVPSANGILNIASYFSFLTKVLPKPHNKKSLYNYLFRLLTISGKKDLDFYLSSTTDLFEDEYLFKPNYIFEKMNKLIKDTSLDPLSKMLYLDSKMLLFSDLLVKMDIATMVNSIEGRSPFMSKYMLEFAPTLKNKFKIKGIDTKYILRELSKKYLPVELITQPKRGFEVPLKKWVEGDLKDNIFQSLSNNSYSSNFIEQSFIKKLLNKELDISDEKRAKMLWNMYCLEVWKRNQ
ncbi:asparagine synthase (glutamine-hydrolyzing) [Aliarcobacter cryaerophilus]|uniref:asparagine synthase (glutamine-hydrolyzing) n=1 Tax=Aliarcobacter cryaerophilus TaxID=28198 RepID=UPI000834F9BF|nr:asparagine synthase (glutamine-hydrolyzing) [Aliarcobacter cryaerophilus]